MTTDVFGLVGATLEGRYRLLSVIGVGGFGVVYRGVQITFDTPVAVKVLRSQSHAPEEQERLLARFRDEAVLLERLNRCSPDIVRVLDFGLRELSPSQSVPYLVMEWLDGRPLDEAIAVWRKHGQVPMTEGNALSLLSPALRALAAAHRGEAGSVVAHRDVKPQNLFVLQAGGLKVLDLGIAKVMQQGEGITAQGSQTSSGFSAFSPLYGAPEQFHPKRFGQTGPWTDVHALALVLVELISGRRALDGDDYPSCFAASTSPERPTPRACGASVSEGFERVCARALSLDPRQRYQSAGELLEALLHPERETAGGPAPGASLEALTEALGRETDPRRKARHHMALGVHFCDVAGEIELASESFEAALDCDPSWLEPFERLVSLLTAQQAWPSLSRAYRKMLQRCAGKGDAELEARLFLELGLVYRDRLREPSPALAAIDMAVRAKPQALPARQALAALYAQTDQLDLAVRENETLFQLDPTQAAPLHELFRLHTARGARDAAWCVAAALASLKAASDDERRLHEDFRPTGLPSVKGRLDDATWRERLFTPEVNTVVSKIFEVLAPAALAILLAEAQRAGQPASLQGAITQDPKTTRVTFAKLFAWTADVLGITSPPPLYLHTSLKEGLLDVVYEQLVVVAGQKVLLTSPYEVTFACGRHLARHRPELVVRTIFPALPQLELLLLSGIKAARPDWSPPAAQTQVPALARALTSSMTPVQAQRLRSAVGVFFNEGAKINLKRWGHGAEQSAIRAGLLLCGDLEQARKALEAEPPWPGTPTAAEQFRELLVYAVSGPYVEARKTIGVSVG